MTNPTSITIDEVKYVREDSVQAGPPTKIMIVVIEGRWNFVGNVAPVDDDGYIVITNTKCIRYWGTNDKQGGLGWLALNGPTNATKLDPTGTIRVPANKVLLTLDVNTDKWS